jgi:hypothetical protein
MTLFGIYEAQWMLVIAGILASALLLMRTIRIVQCEVRRRGPAKVLLFLAFAAPVAYWAGGKGGGDRGEAGVRLMQLPLACDVGDGDGFGGMPAATNLATG